MEKRGSRAAAQLRQLVEKYGDDLFRMVSWHCQTQPADTEEALSQTWAWLLAHPQRLEELMQDGDCFGYLYAAACHNAFGLLKKSRQTIPEEAADTLPDDTADVEALVLQREEVQAVYRDIRQLPEELQTVFLLRYVSDCSNTEIARLLGISPGLVATRLSRARAKLAEGIRKRREAEDA